MLLPIATFLVIRCVCRAFGHLGERGRAGSVDQRERLRHVDELEALKVAVGSRFRERDNGI